MEVFLTKVSHPSTITIGVCSDTHYWFGGSDYVGESLQLQGDSELLFETLLAEMKEAKLDLVIHLGDMVSGGGTFQMFPSEFQKSLKQASIGFQSLSAEVFAIPGNHDCLVGDAWSEFGRLWALERGLGRTVDTAHARLVLLNGQGHSDEQIAEARPTDPVYGWISEAELARLEDALATAGDKPVVLFTHQLLVPWSSDREWRSFYGTDNAHSVLELMKCYKNVRAVFQGHAHRFDIQSIPLVAEPDEANLGEHINCTFVILPSLIEYPLGWLKLTIAEENLTITLQKLPLNSLAEKSRTSGQGQQWRIGHRAWSQYQINL